MRRLFFVNRYFFPDESATSQLLSDLAFFLAEQEFEVHIVCSRQLYGAADADLAASETIRGVRVHRLWTTSFGRAWLPGRALDYLSFHAVCAVTLLFTLRRADIVVAKTDPPLISIAAWLSSRLKRATLINWLQDVFPEILGGTELRSPAVPLQKLLRGLRDMSLRAAACNVVLGDRMREYLSTRAGSGANFQVIENWADGVGPRPPRAAESSLRIREGFAGKFVVGYSGNLGRAHEYDTILGAAEALRTEEATLFLFIGGGAKMASLQAAVQQRGLMNFAFLPYQPRSQLADSLAAADVHLVSLLPSLEGLIVPSKFYGVLAAGRPVLFVGDPDGELARIVRDRRCGHAVATGDSAGLAKALLALKDAASTRETMGTAARELLISRFSKERAMSSWLALLRKA